MSESVTRSVWMSLDLDPRLQEYMDELRKSVCAHCIEKPPGGPPCLPLGKRCGLEINLAELILAVQHQNSQLMEPYTNGLHGEVCAHCINKPTDQCPCPLEYLLPLAVEAIETVTERRRARGETEPPLQAKGA